MLLFATSLAETFLSLYYILKLSRFKTTIDKVQKHHKEIVVLGNGPSLKKDLDAGRISFDQRDKLCVNNFVTSDFYHQLRPNLYILMDNVYWEKEVLEEMKQQVENTFQQINERTQWPLSLMIPYQASSSERLKILTNPLINVVFFNAAPVTGFKAIRLYLYKRNLGMPPAQNVMIAALFIALNLGYKKLFLLGADHSFHKNLELDENNTVCFKDHHFYDEKEVTLVPLYKGSADNSVFTMREIFAAMSLMFKGYEMIEQYACSLHSKVYNLSSVTYIDAFERRSDS